MILIWLTCTVCYVISQVMGVPRQLTERQMKFAELLIYNEGRMSPAECALQAGYKTRPRQAASELRNPKISPLVVQYIGELRAEVQENHGQVQECQTLSVIMIHADYSWLSLN